MFIVTTNKKFVQAPQERNETSKHLRPTELGDASSLVVYKHSIPKGLTCPRNFAKKKKSGPCYTENSPTYREGRD